MDFLPNKFNMSNISSTDASIHSTQDLIRALQNPAPSSLLVPLGGAHTYALRILAGVFNKPPPRARPPRVVPPSTQQQHQPILSQTPNTVKTPDHTKPSSVPIAES